MDSTETTPTTTHSATMATSTLAEQHLALINHLLSEKDRLIAEKDELVLSKDKLWREMHDMVRQRDAEIEHFKMSTYQGREDSKDGTGSEENAKLRERNKQLEAALETLLAQEPEEGEEMDVEEVDEEDKLDEQRRVAAMGDEKSHARMYAHFGHFLSGAHTDNVPSKPDIDDDESLMRRTDVVLDRRVQCGYPEATTGPARHPSVVVSQPPSFPTTFTFAPLILISDGGGYELGDIKSVAPAVIRSIRSQLETLANRNKEGRSPTAPSTQYRSTGCFWNWMMSSAQDTRWTLADAHRFTCAGCFDARRACLFWMGNRKWIILPLPPAVRATEATWTDAAYYISEGGEHASQFADIWLAGAWTKRKRSAR